MRLVATLIGSSSQPLRGGHVEAAMHLGGSKSPPEWLSENEACDIFVDGDSAALREKLEGWAIGEKLDVIVQPLPGRRKKTLLADMESTVIHQEMLDELAAYVGKEAEVKEITRRSMNGELDFRAALKERLGLLKGLPSSVVDELKKRITYMDGAAELVATMRAKNNECILVSGGFTCFIEPVATALGFHSFHGNVLEVKDGKLTGEIAEPVLDKNSKRAILTATIDRLQLAATDIIAVGDGANDIPMLEAAGLGIAFHGKPNVQKAATHNIRFASLRALLWAQGYTRDAISYRP
jgi:phosphoserine phosphatase